MVALIMRGADWYELLKWIAIVTVILGILVAFGLLVPLGNMTEPRR
jgi:hypothetical protein